MQIDCDVALVGTGVAPLVAARHLLAQGRQVLVLNPDRDFFLEDSELALDPLTVGTIDSDRISRSDPDRVLSELQPEFPGSVERWPISEGFHDANAPHVRARSGLWVTDAESQDAENGTFERLYLETSDAGFNPVLLDGLQARSRFPGGSTRTTPRSWAVVERLRGLQIPRFCDVDAGRYRNGLLEFVRERLGPDLLIQEVVQLEPTTSGIRFHGPGGASTVRLKSGMLVFWTPRLTSWTMAQAKRTGAKLAPPVGVRAWEEWTLVSREAVDPSVVGVYGDMIVWAEAQGAPKENIHRLSVLRSGPRAPLETLMSPGWGRDWASSESFSRLSALCKGFLQWETFSIRALKPRVLFEWGLPSSPSTLNARNEIPVRLVRGCDGPLADVVTGARAACELFSGDVQ